MFISFIIKVMATQNTKLWHNLHILSFSTVSITIIRYIVDFVYSITWCNLRYISKLCFKKWVLHQKQPNGRHITFSVFRHVDMSVDVSVDHIFNMTISLKRGVGVYSVRHVINKMYVLGCE